jgi:hypothetical protein
MPRLLCVFVLCFLLHSNVVAASAVASSSSSFVVWLRTLNEDCLDASKAFSVWYAQSGACFLNGDEQLGSQRVICSENNTVVTSETFWDNNCQTPMGHPINMTVGCQGVYITLLCASTPPVIPSAVEALQYASAADCAAGSFFWPVQLVPLGKKKIACSSQESYVFEVRFFDGAQCPASHCLVPSKNRHPPAAAKPPVTLLRKTAHHTTVPPGQCP